LKIILKKFSSYLKDLKIKKFYKKRKEEKEFENER
jgi:hypothetical protein